MMPMNGGGHITLRGVLGVSTVEEEKLGECSMSTEIETRIATIVEQLKDSTEWKTVEKFGGDPIALITEDVERLMKYRTDKTAVSFARAKFIRFVNQQNMESVIGVVVGGVDRYGSKAPITYPVIKKDGTMTKVCTWDTELIPIPSIIEVKGKYNGEYQNYLIDEEMGLLDCKDAPDVLKLLTKVSMPVTTDFSNVGKYDTVVIRGFIKSVFPSPIWENGQKVSSYNVLEFNEAEPPRKTPCMDIRLESGSGNNVVTFQLTRQRRGMPVIAIDDFIEICKDAVELCEDDPVEQCKFVRDGIFGREVVAIGEVSSITEKVSESTMEPVLYINVRIAAIYEIPFNPVPITNTKVEKPSKPAPSPTKSDDSDEEVEEAPVKVVDAKAQATLEKLDNMVSDIITVCRVTKKSPVSLTVEQVRDALDIPDTTSNMLIKIAIEKASEKWLAMKKAAKQE